MAQAATGDLSQRLPLSEEGHPQVIELEYGLNTLLDELAQTKADSESRQQQLSEQAHKMLQQQQEMLRLMSTPVIHVWPGVLALPIIGEVSSERAAQMTESVLAKVVQARASHLILDLTGMTSVESGTTRSLLQLAESVQLLGARCLLTGVGAALASMLVQQAGNLAHIVSLPTLADAIALVLQQRGVRLIAGKR